MSVDTMGTRVALDVVGGHGALGSLWVLKLTHGSILPGVFASIKEKDVVTLDIKTSVMGVSLVFLSQNGTAEYALAVVLPEGQSEGAVTHGLLNIRRLEEAEFVALLPDPLTTC